MRRNESLFGIAKGTAVAVAVVSSIGFVHSCDIWRVYADTDLGAASYSQDKGMEVPYLVFIWGDCGNIFEFYHKEYFATVFSHYVMTVFGKFTYTEIYCTKECGKGDYKWIRKLLVLLRTSHGLAC